MGETVQEKTAHGVASGISSPDSPQKKEGTAETRQVEEYFASPTPVKKKEPSRVQSKDELVQLPEKWVHSICSHLIRFKYKFNSQIEKGEA